MNPRIQITTRKACQCGNPNCNGQHQMPIDPNLTQAAMMTQQAQMMLANPNISAEEKAAAIQMLSDALALSTDIINAHGGIKGGH